MDVLVQRPGNATPILVEVIHVPRDASDLHRLASQMTLFSRADSSLGSPERILLVVCRSEEAVLQSRDLFRAVDLPYSSRRVIGAKPNGSGLDVLWSLP
jgi:hypothetical protein